MSAMPNGELRCSRKTERWSATPSPSVSRRSVIRLALGTVRVSVDGGKVMIEGKVGAWHDRAVIERAA